MTEHSKPNLDLTLFGEEHVRLYRETAGETGHMWNGVTTLLLTTKGRKSGEQRVHPMIYGKEGDLHVVIASQGGAPTHPHWYLNLLQDPNVEVQAAADVFSAVARIAEGEEREQLWQMMAAAWPSFDTYQSRTERVIPVVVLDRVS